MGLLSSTGAQLTKRIVVGFSKNMQKLVDGGSDPGLHGEPYGPCRRDKKLAESVQTPCPILCGWGLTMGRFLGPGPMTMFLISSILRSPPQENLATGPSSTGSLFPFLTCRPVP